MKGFIASQIMTVAVVVVIIISIIVVLLFALCASAPLCPLGFASSEYLINPVESSGKLGIMINIISEFEYNDKKFIDASNDALMNNYEFKKREEFENSMKRFLDVYIESNVLDLYDIKLKNDDQIIFSVTSLDLEEINTEQQNFCGDITSEFYSNQCDDISENLGSPCGPYGKGKLHYECRKLITLDGYGNIINVDDKSPLALPCCSDDPTVLSDINKAKTVRIPLFYQDKELIIEVIIA